MTSFTIAHISDLHFSNGTAKDPPEGLSHSISHLQQIQSRFQGRDFDRVIVSGDLTDHGDIESFIRVKEWLHNDEVVS
jgi:3',5'-cyclic AMP phosphodiesterase CpdA